MRDIITVLAKELREQVGDRPSLKGSLVQGAFLIAACGLLIPRDPHVWADVRHLAVIYAVFPSSIGTSVAADAFAGERERRTLETLLATPLSESAIFLGKAAAALSVVMVVALSSFGCAVTFASAGDIPRSMRLVSMLGGVMATAFSVGTFAVALAIAVSSRVRVARTAQQLSSIITLFLIAFLGVPLFRANPDDWWPVLQIDAVVLLLSIALFAWAIKRFGRDRIFEET